MFWLFIKHRKRHNRNFFFLYQKDSYVIVQIVLQYSKYGYIIVLYIVVIPVIFDILVVTWFIWYYFNFNLFLSDCI